MKKKAKIEWPEKSKKNFLMKNKTFLEKKVVAE